MMRQGLVGFVAVATLACGGMMEEKPKSMTRTSVWSIDGVEDPARLEGAVMDLYGGDPGPICFHGEPEAAVRVATVAFGSSEKFRSAKVVGDEVVISTRNPFDPEAKDGSSSFKACEYKTN
jgi:hypothetical protein